MAYLNQVDPAVVDQWMSNFATYPDNIQEPFQSNPVEISRSTFDLLCGNNSRHINLYFGLDDLGNPVLIAVASYLLDAYDGQATNGYADILETDKIIELYSESPISLQTAQDYVNNWHAANLDNPLFLFSALQPRPNFVKLFLEDKVNSALVFFGLDNNNKLKVMQRDASGANPIAYNSGITCTPNGGVNICCTQGLLQTII